MDPTDPRSAFQTSHPLFGRVMVAPVALVVRACPTCGARTKQRGQCQLCRDDDERKFYQWQESDRDLSQRSQSDA